jgi:hypothetical protein
MTIACVRAGWRAALANRKLILTLWGWSTLLALPVGAAVWRWLGAAFNHSPAADRLLERLQLGLAVELTQYDRFSPLPALSGAVLGLAVVALISNPLLAAGVLEAIVSGDDRPLLHRFFRGAGHFFGRFLRLLLISGVAAVLLVIVAGIITRPITSALSETSWERTSLTAGFARRLLAGFLIAFVMVVLDVARTQVVTADSEVRGMLRTWFRAARFVLRNFGVIAGTYTAFGLMFLAVVVVYAVVVNVIPTGTWAGIWLVILLQQLFVMTRAGLRVARAGGAVELCRVRAVSAPVLQP